MAAATGPNHAKLARSLPFLERPQRSDRRDAPLISSLSYRAIKLPAQCAGATHTQLTSRSWRGLNRNRACAGKSYCSSSADMVRHVGHPWRMYVSGFSFWCDVMRCFSSHTPWERLQRFIFAENEATPHCHARSIRTQASASVVLFSG